VEVKELVAIERNTKGKVKEMGFIAGVIYGGEFKTGVPIKVDEKVLSGILKRHGSHAKVIIDYRGDKKDGFIRELQRDPVSGRIYHIDIQLAGKEQQVKLQIPINYMGEGELAKRQLIFQAYKAEIELSGKMDMLPEVIEVDLSMKELGDTITIKDLHIDDSIKLSNRAEDIFGIITHADIIKTNSEIAENPA
jgi:large subunit ribosomal protein L25